MISRIEYLYSEAEAQADGLSGVVMPYGELAPRVGYKLQVPKGSLAGRMSDVLVNVQHDDKQLLGRTGGNVQLTDTEQKLLLAMTYPDTQAGHDAKTLVDIGVLKGFSAELTILSDTWIGGIRRVDRAALTGIALVARPAMKNAVLLSGDEVLEGGYVRFNAESLQKRALRGDMPWGEPSVISMVRQTAVLFERDSLDISNPITLMLGSDYNASAANTADNGALKIQKTNAGISWRVDNMPRTDNGEKILQLSRAGLLTGWRVGYGARRSRRTKIELEGLQMDLEIVQEGILCDVRLSSHAQASAGRVRGSRRRRR